MDVLQKPGETRRIPQHIAFEILNLNLSSDITRLPRVPSRSQEGEREGGEGAEQDEEGERGAKVLN